MGNKGDISDFEHVMVISARWVKRFLETTDLLGFPLTNMSRVYRDWSGKEKISSEQEFSG